MKLIVWLRGILSAAIGAAANSVTVMIVDPVNFNLQQNASKVGWVALISAIVAVAMYLKTSPLPNGATSPAPVAQDPGQKSP